MNAIESCRARRALSDSNTSPRPASSAQLSHPSQALNRESDITQTRSVAGAEHHDGTQRQIADEATRPEQGDIKHVELLKKCTRDREYAPINSQADMSTRASAPTRTLPTRAAERSDYAAERYARVFTLRHCIQCEVPHRLHHTRNSERDCAISDQLPSNTLQIIDRNYRACSTRQQVAEGDPVTPAGAVMARGDRGRC